MTRYFAFSLLLLAFLAVPCQAFDSTRARTILDAIASDAFEGRRPGSAGGMKTEEYLAENFRVCGVEPGARAGYFQDVPLLLTEDAGSDLTIMDHEFGKITFQSGIDFHALNRSGSGSVIAPVVVAGYGYVRPDKNRDDYGSIDVSGKVVLIVRGTPASSYDFQTDFNRRSTIQWAREHKAAAVLYYQEADPLNGAAVASDVYDPNLPVLYVGERVFNLLLDNTGYSVESYLEAIKRAPLPLATEKNVYVSTRLRKLPSQKSRNVLGIVYGTDPVLKNEIIVIGAHWDHLGKDSRGAIYNGADDNGSGTAMVAELARVFAASPLKRSVMLMHFTAEESGLEGSDYFVRNPSIPFGNIVGMVNLDCEGLGSGNIVMAGGETFGTLWKEYVAGLDSALLPRLLFRRSDGHGRSDHESFLIGGCPALAFWSRGDHPFYHRIDDDAKWISTSVLNAIGTQAEDWVRFIGNREGKQAAHADSLRLLARHAVNLDLNGFAMDPQGTLPELSAISAAWLPRDAMLTAAEAIRRASELQYICTSRNVTCGGLKSVLTADRNHKKSAFIGATDADLFSKRAADLDALYRQGITVVRLSTGGTDRNSANDPLERFRKAGAFALVPLDYTAPSRVGKWKDHALVTGALKDFAALPEAIREGLLTSDALLILDVLETPALDDVNTIRSACSRLVHLNFGFLPEHRREEHARAVIGRLFEAGLTRDEVLLIIGGNLRRFLDV
ncbi:M28 family peptidase [candidate division KSB1 bacterium]|nr:MAG: M28 family peptidase [candidate division KSB1 bacterium]